MKSRMPNPPRNLKVHFQTEGRLSCSTQHTTLTTTNLQEVTCTHCLTQHVLKPIRDAQLTEERRRKIEEIHNAKIAFLQQEAENQKADEEKLKARQEALEIRRIIKVFEEAEAVTRPVTKSVRKKNKYTQRDILEYLNVVYWAVNRFLQRNKGYRQQDKEDLAHYGVLGLIHALTYHDEQKGLFISYAIPCIKGAISTGNAILIRGFTPVRNRNITTGKLKGHFYDPVTSLENALEQMTERAFYVSSWGSFRGLGGWSTEGVKEEHLHSPLPSPLACAIKNDLVKTTKKALAQLTPKEAEVLRLRFGIGKNSDHTLDEVGDKFKVTRERIRQLESKALRRLRHPTNAKLLRSFVEFL